MTKLAWFSNAPWTPTGYGMQTKQVTQRMAADGHDVGIIANYGLTGAPQNYGGMPVYPQGTHPYSLDMANDFARIHLEGDPDGRVVVLYDTWPLTEQPDLFKDFDAHYWTPVDHSPVPPKVAEWNRKHKTIAMSRFGEREFTNAGIESRYIPHAIETSIFRPTGSDIRDLLKVPKDAHLTSMVMANIGNSPPRKRWAENLLAWRGFAEKHDDAYLYIHTALRHPRGVDLASSILFWGVPQDRLRIVDQVGYAAGFVTQQELAAIYTASDVLLMATAGEGFGVPAIEAQACGCPVIVSDFSAQPELVGAGWKVPWTPDWDTHQASFHALPSISGIGAALEESYEVSKDATQRDRMRENAIAFAQQYDADKVYDEYWRPWLAESKVKPNRQQRRANKGRAA